MTQRTILLMRKIMSRTLWVLLTLVVGELIAALCYAYFEPVGFWTALWAVDVTQFTVGYGDESPVTRGGMITIAIYMRFCFVMLAVALGHIVGAVIEVRNVYGHREQERDEAARLQVLIKEGIVPPEWREMPPVEWWVETYKFKVSPDGEASM